MKKRILRLSLVYLALLAVGLLYLFLFRRFGFALPCFFHEVTGWNCPGCGLTRAAGAISRLSFAEALGYNPMIPFYAVYGGWYAVTTSVRYLKGEKHAAVFGPDWAHWVALALVLAFWILRNLVTVDTL